MAVMLIALGGTLALEGVGWAVMPATMRRLWQEAMSQDDRTLHVTGLFSVAAGVALLMWGVQVASA